MWHLPTPAIYFGPQSFHFPLFMTMLHLAVIFLFSALSRALVQCSSHRARVVLSWTDYLRRVAPTGRPSVRGAAPRSSPPFSHGCVSAKQEGSILACAGARGPCRALPGAERGASPRSHARLGWKIS